MPYAPPADPRKQAPIRNFGQYGVITDIDPYDLPPSAFSFGQNVRFRNGRVHTGPLFKNVYHLSQSNPRFLAAFIPESGLDQIFTGYESGHIYLYSSANADETDYSAGAAFTAAIASTTMTVSAVANGVLYLGMAVAGTNVTSGTVISDFGVAQLTGCTISGTTLSVGSVSSGTINAGMVLTDASGLVQYGTTIVSGSGLTWTVSISQTVSGAENMTCTSNGGAGNYTVSKSSTASSTSMTGTYVSNTVEGDWTSLILADCIYINRPDRAPWVLTPGATQFSQLPNWPSDTTCGILRQCGGALVALNITADGVTTPNMLLSSSFAEANAVPASWDYANITTLATQNILAELEGPIIDACNMGRDLFIYSTDQVWRMTLSGDSNVFDFYKLPFQKGAINSNCVTQINSQHFVFGATDIWVNDGFSEQSICDGKVRDFIYGNIDMTQSDRCFVTYNQYLSELHFNFVSGDGYTKFPDSGATNPPGGCNRCAVYNISNQTWSFDDRPYVYFADWMNLDSTLTYTSVSQTYAQIQGSYQDQDDTQKRLTAYIGDTYSTGNVTASLYAFDPPSSSLPGAPPALVSFSIDENASGTPYLERNGIDLDALGLDLQGYKQVNYVIPLARIDPLSSQTINFNFGGADLYNESPSFTGYQTYDGVNYYKLDFYQPGRYLFLEIEFEDWNMFTLSGLDLDVLETAER